MEQIKCPACSLEISDKAEKCPSCGHPIRAGNSEPEFRAWRKRRMIRLMILCAAAIPIGIILKNPAVWILGIAGVILGEMKLLHFMAGSGGTTIDPEKRAPGWQIRCTKCGFTEPWGKYGIRFFAIGTSYTIGWCNTCRWIRFHAIEKTRKIISKPEDSSAGGPPA